MSAPEKKCAGLVENRDGEPTWGCGENDGQLCADCLEKECAYWSRHFGQNYGTKEEKAARLAAMRPDMPRESDFRSDAEIEEAQS